MLDVALGFLVDVWIGEKGGFGDRSDSLCLTAVRGPRDDRSI
jgi:hypothetical protein